MGHGQNPTLTVPGKEQRPHTVIEQPLFRIQTISQQIVKTEPAAVGIDTVPGQMQGSDGKPVFPETVQEGPVLDRAKHGPRIKHQAGGTRTGP